MECVEAKDYGFEDVCETGATGCEETCIWSMEQLWNILSGVRRGLCCNELHCVGENSNLFGGWKRILSCQAAIPPSPLTIHSSEPCRYLVFISVSSLFLSLSQY